MKIAVFVKSVPNPEQYDQIRLDPVRKTVIREGVESVLNGADLHAIELAMQLKEAKGGTVTLISMGPSGASVQLREGLSYGCDDAYVISDRKFGGADSLATSYTLAKAVEKIGTFDLYLLENASDDGTTAHVPSQLGELLELPHMTDVTGFEAESDKAVLVKKSVGKSVNTYRITLPAVIGIDRKLNQVRHPNVRGIFSAKKKPLVTLTTEEMDALEEERLGLAGSPTQPGEYRDVEYGRQCKELESTAELLKVISGARR